MTERDHIRDDDELLAQFCDTFGISRDKSLRKEIAQTDEYLSWAYKERSKDIMREANKLMTY